MSGTAKLPDSEAIVIARSARVARWDEATLRVRLHRGAIAAAEPAAIVQLASLPPVVDRCGRADPRVEKGALESASSTAESGRDLELVLIEAAASRGLDPRRLMLWEGVIVCGRNHRCVALQSEDLDVSKAESVAWVIHVADARIPRGGTLMCELLPVEPRDGEPGADVEPLATLEPGLVTNARTFVLPVSTKGVGMLRMRIVGTNGATIRVCAAIGF